MAQTFLNINEAAELTDKSVQTIRRAIKNKKIKARKKKTPQGYNYMIDKESLASVYKFIKKSQNKNTNTKVKKPSKKKTAKASKEIQKQYLTQDDIGTFENTIKKLISQHEKDKENLFRLIKGFQDRIVALENQVKLLDQPKKKWYQVWK